jgi:hypothetical protein
MRGASARGVPQSYPLLKGSTLHVPVEFWNKPAKEREVLPLAITTHYSQCPGGRAPLDAGALLAHNGKIAVYSQYFLKAIWGFASEAASDIVS